jgi:hypothetical protein
MKKYLAVAIAIGSLIGTAKADSYQIHAARVSGQYVCQYSQSNGGSLNCATSYSGQAIVPITMNEKQDGTGYAGMDQITDQSSVYLLTLEADSSKALKSVATTHLEESSNTTIDGGISASDTNSISIVNFAPIHIERVDAQTLKLNMAFYAYAPASNSDISSSNALMISDHKALNDRLSSKIRPVIDAIFRQ